MNKKVRLNNNKKLRYLKKKKQLQIYMTNDKSYRKINLINCPNQAYNNKLFLIKYQRIKIIKLLKNIVIILYKINSNQTTINIYPNNI